MVSRVIYSTRSHFATKGGHWLSPLKSCRRFSIVSLETAKEKLSRTSRTLHGVAEVDVVAVAEAARKTENSESEIKSECIQLVATKDGR